MPDFHVGDHVLYVPHHAQGDRKHRDCQSGVVTSINVSYVFVRYGSRTHSQATYPEDLINETRESATVGKGRP